MKGSPSIISRRMAAIYHRAGTMHDSHCSGAGMFPIGKTMPESMIIGMSMSMAETNRAATCVRATVEMKSPRASARTM